MSEYIHINHGDNARREELMEMLDLTFGFEKKEEQFENLLPKLYKEEYKPAQNNIVLDVNGEMRAAIGLYYNTLTVCGETLKAGGIGNVACHPDHREKGYMRFCMAYALDEMKQNMTDISYLCGARQRYERYSYEPAGERYEFSYNKSNVRRRLGAEKKSKFKGVRIQRTDTELLKAIADIYDSRDFKAERPLESIYDILLTWRCEPYAALDGDNFKGWFVLNLDHTAVSEIGYANADDIEEIAICALETSGSPGVKISTPAFDAPLVNYLSVACEYYSRSHPDQYTVFCYENVIRAFLKLKSTYQPLTDGECVLLIEGVKLPEQIKISVKDNQVSVEETDEKPDLALTHTEAMRLIGSLHSEKRKELSPECAAWFPLPLYTYSQDNV